MNWRTTMLAFSLLFWGWWVELMPIAILFTLIIILAPGINHRLELRDRHFNVIVDLSSVVIAIVGFYLIFTSGRQGIFLFLAWSPVLLFPLFAAQQFSIVGTINLSSLFLAMRSQQRIANAEIIRVDLAWPYAGLCVLSASAMVTRHELFYPSLFIIVALALTASRPGRFHPGLWAGMLIIAGVLGYGGQFGLRTLHQQVEEIGMSLLEDLLSADRDISHTSTAIGYLGEIKTSNRIVWQLHANNENQPPRLLKQASYQTYRYGSWLAVNDNMTDLKASAERHTWRIDTGTTDSSKSIRLSGNLGKGVLPIPPGVNEIRNLPAANIRQSQLGAVVVTDGPVFADFNLGYTGVSSDEPPGPIDLEIPTALRPTLEQLAHELGLDKQQPQQSLQRIESFFRDNFTYSLYLQGVENDSVPLKTFLLKHRRGHCEYFATAGVMLLRAAGIPARYAGGFAVTEHNEITDSWLIRKRHAHAWSQAYVNGKWINQDYTPPQWVLVEEEATTPWYGFITDLLVIISHAFKMDGHDTENKLSTSRAAIAIALLLLGVYWIYRKQQKQQHGKVKKEIHFHRGQDSPFYRVIRSLETAGHGPRGHETLKQWITRLKTRTELVAGPKDLEQLLELHYRYRYAENAGASIKTEMAELADSWIKRQGIFLEQQKTTH